MKILCLGTGGSEGMPVLYCDCRICKSGETRCRTSYLIKLKEANILVEIGPDFRRQKLEYGFDFDYLFISHEHSDHYYGLQDLRHVYLIAKIKIKAKKMIISQRFHDALLHSPMVEREGLRYAYTRLVRTKKIKSNILKYWKLHDFGEFKMLIFSNKHANTYSDGFFLESGNRKLIYLGDAGMINKRTRKLIEAVKPDLLIAHTPIIIKEGMKHLGIETLTELPAKRIMISHISHKANLLHKELKKKMREYDSKIIVARDGLEVKV